MTEEEIKNWYIKKQKLYFASIELTQNCNFQCKHCYCPDKQCSTLSLNEFKVIIDKLHDTGCLYLSLTGGEIFTYKYFKELYTYAKTKGFIIDLVTNVSLINTDLINLFKNLPPRNITITLYGTCKKEYAEFTGKADNYTKVMNGLNLLKSNKIPFYLRTVATKTFKKSLEEGNFEKIAKKFETDFRYDPIIFPKISGDKTPLNECLNAKEIAELEKSNILRKNAWEDIFTSTSIFEWKCKAGINSIAIDYQGNAFVCGLYRKQGISILDNDINIVLKTLKNIHENHNCIIKENKCAKCEMRKICKWCPAYSLIYNNNEYDKIDFFCELARERKRIFDSKK